MGILALVTVCAALSAVPSSALGFVVSSPDKSFFDTTPPSDAPEAKKNWRLVREAASDVNGPIPVVLIHGQSMDRWGNFIDWASTCGEPEAVQFRRSFQIWNYLHSNIGVDAAIGYSPDYPAFGESIAAYLDRFITAAIVDGVDAGGKRHYFPPGPFGIVTHSQGGLIGRAFLTNFPEHATRVFGVVTLSAPHLGTPWATPEWVRSTVNRVSLSRPAANGGIMLQGLFCHTALTAYFSTAKQSDLDMGWVNLDQASGLGIPQTQLRTWKPGRGFVTLRLSPRDSSQTLARALPGYSDTTFEPETLLSTYCGGLDEIVPQFRGDLCLERFFLYGSYVEPDGSAWQALNSAGKVIYDTRTAAGENALLGVANVLMGLVPSPGADAPAGAYRVSDGFVPLQSQLMLDGREGGLIYEVSRSCGRYVPVCPIRLKKELLRAHTLANPDRIRVLPGYSHLDTGIGKYDAKTRHSELFAMVARDLLSVAPTG
ncbi:MAG: hypothetical protein HZB26_16205 [Candidatus Hydrogenedentes bacterium]|nr:hypothetical protein [Candidatus Hydrogenedentota bacterium]